MTLLELMVAMTVLVVVIGWVLVAYTNQQRSQLDHERVIEAQHEGRLITDLLVADLRMAGFLMPTDAAVASIDGGNAASDTICTSDPGIIDPAILPDQDQRFLGAPASAMSATSVTVGGPNLDVDGSGNIDFIENRGIIISDGVNVHCAKINPGGVNPVSGAISFSPATAAAFVTTDTVVVPALYYEINGTDLERNDTVLSSQVEDIQIEYWVDTDGDSQMDPNPGVEFPIHDLAGQDLSQLRLARVSVTSRTTRNDSPLAGNAFPAVANRAAGPADNFKRRRQIAETLLRNVR
jgi:hypothetical protein